MNASTPPDSTPPPASSPPASTPPASTPPASTPPDSSAQDIPMYPHAVLAAADVGLLFMEVYDELGVTLLVGRTYNIAGSGIGGPFSGTVDSDGRLRHEAVPSDDYTLTVDGAKETAAAIVLAQDETDPQVRFLDMGDPGTEGPSSS